MLVSVVQQRGLNIYIIYMLFFRLFSIVDYYKILNIVSHAK